MSRMRIQRIDRKEGIIRVTLQTLEDVWHLYKVLEEGDLVKAKTYRKVAVKRGQEIMEGEKKPVLLTIKLEKTEFHQYTGKLRLSGTITEGPEDIQLASHHTITMEPGIQVTVTKPSLKQFHVDRLKKARVREENIVFVAMDRDQADFARLQAMGLELKGSIRFKKRDEDEDRTEWYEHIATILEAEQEYGKIVICGPGFERENFLAYLKKQHPGLAGRAILEHASTTGQPGIQEVIKNSEAKILGDARITRETTWIEKLLVEIRKQGLAVHGVDQVKKGLEYGAISTVLISDLKVREYEQLLDQAESIAAQIVLISGEHEAGEQLLALGGIAGLLRYKI